MPDVEKTVLSMPARPAACATRPLELPRDNLVQQSVNLVDACPEYSLSTERCFKRTQEQWRCAEVRVPAEQGTARRSGCLQLGKTTRFSSYSKLRMILIISCESLAALSSRIVSSKRRMSARDL
jgi:hypothetical protein